MTHNAPPLLSAAEVEECLTSMADPEQSLLLKRFFKTAPGQYGHGDEFLGIRVPATRLVARRAADVPVEQIPALLASRWHEVRLCGLLLLVRRFERLSTRRLAADSDAIARRDGLLALYLAHAHRASNWDLVDLSAPGIVGLWLTLPSGTTPAADRERKVATLDALAGSDNLWRQRISMVCTITPTRAGDPSWALTYAERHLAHKHDLMHKAVGWMLREVGKHAGHDVLREFLERHAGQMPRTALRYAIEHLSPDERKAWLAK